MFAKHRTLFIRAAGAIVLTAAAVLPLAVATPAYAWWRPVVGVYLPPVYVAPPVYVPPPVYVAPPYAYYAPGPVYVGPRYYGGYYGHGYYRR
jgi:hypothetical protein